MKKKNSKIKGFVFLILIVTLTTSAFYVYSGMTLFTPKDLGISYTPDDYSRALRKTGIDIIVDVQIISSQKQTQPGVFLGAIGNFGSAKQMIDDYNFEFSDYERKTFILTSQEATAFLNGVAPNFFWFDNIQIKAMQDGNVEASSTVSYKKLMTELFSDVADEIPFPLPDRVNIHGITSINVTNNKLSWKPESFHLGPVPLPENYMDVSTLRAIQPYLERLYTVVPGLEIISLTVQSGNFAVDAIIPQKVVVTKKQIGNGKPVTPNLPFPIL